MGKIIKLSQEITNLIAAGEVIERAASVVKELVENAIDANAKNIDVVLRDAGLTEIIVRDDGDGMDPSDARLAIEPHATSKIHSSNDLFSIQTLGFRGEALPSIVSVSNFSLKTSHDGKRGVIFTLRGGKLVSEAVVAYTKGTEISVKNLFFNTPARLHNLSSQAVELSFIVDYVTKQALATPHIAFSLRNNERELIKTFGNNELLEVIMATYGTEVARNMFAFSKTSSLCTIEGYTSNLKISRSSRHHIHVTVNNRSIKNYKVVQAVIKAYQDRLVIGRYPITVLDITVDPGLVDVNVHPAKLEVRFANEAELLSFITDTLDYLLQTSDLVINLDAMDDNQTDEVARKESFIVREDDQQISYIAAQQPTKEVTVVDKTNETFTQQQYHLLDEVEDDTDANKYVLPKMEYIGQLFGTYVLAQTETAFFIIDQHAAAERINYEKILKAIQSDKHDTQELLIPLQLSFSLAETIEINERLPQITSLGITLEPFGSQTFLVRSIPTWVFHGREQEFVEEMITHIIQNKKQEKHEFLSNLAKSLACKKSIKANEYHSQDEINHLLDQLTKADNPYTCPHGRPTIVKFSQYEIEKWFKRIV